MDEIFKTLFARFDALTEAVTKQTSISERLLAGQQAALEKIEGGKAPAGTTTRGRKPKDEPAPAGNAEPAATESPAAAATTVNELPTFADVDAFKTWVSTWTSAVEGDERAKRIDFLKSVAGVFGGAGFSGAFSGGAKAVFFIERAKQLGIDKVDLKADYDFAGDPSQEVTAAAGSGSDDDFG